MAIVKFEEFDLGVTDVLVIAVPLRRGVETNGIYTAAHYEGCPACLSEQTAQIVIDQASDGFLFMLKEGHADAAHG